MKNTENLDGHYYMPLYKREATGAKRHSEIVSGEVTAGEASLNYSPIVFTVPSNSPRSLCEVNSAQFPNAEK